MTLRAFAIICVLFGALKLSASCCSGNSSAGIGSLKAHERAYVAFINGAHRVMGTFDPNARFRPGLPSHLPHWRFNHELQAMARLSSFMHPFLKIPARTQISKEGSSNNLADISVGLHLPLVEENFWPSWPKLSLTTSLKIPSGVAAQDQPDLKAEDITSTGTYEIGTSVMAQKSVGSVVFAIGYGIAFSPSLLSRASFKNGVTHSPSAGFTFSPHEKGHMQLTLTNSYVSAAKVNGQALEGSSKRELALALAYGLMLHSHLTLNATLGTHLPFGKNSSADLFAQLGIRIGVF